MSEFNILGLVIVGGVFGIGFLILGIYMCFDKNPRSHIRKPPKSLNPLKKK